MNEIYFNAVVVSCGALYLNSQRSLSIAIESRFLHRTLAVVPSSLRVVALRKNVNKWRPKYALYDGICLG